MPWSPTTTAATPWFAVAANSLTAGGVFMFPVLAPPLAALLKFSQPQLTTIAVAGLIGQYPFSPLVGRIIDLYGSHTCSLTAGVLFFLSFSSTALEVAMASPDVTQPSTSSFCRLTFFFLMAGLATVFSYFSSIFAATKMLPHRPGLASGSSMAVFGLSPLFLSILSSAFFIDSASGLLRPVPFLIFLALVTIATHILGTFAYRGLAPDPTMTLTGEEQVGPIDENTPLLPRKLPDPLRDPCFWILALYCLLVIGASEMVISNLGTIVMSLQPRTFPPDPRYWAALTSPIGQVKILSVSNTTSRLIIGPLADYISPVHSIRQPNEAHHPRKHQISRIAFLTGAASCLVIAFLWMETCVQSREGLWVLSVGVGISYGATFTVLPGIVSSVWGAANLGRNFGFMTYAPFVGTPLFSFLYACVSAAHAQDTTICQGISCWRTTFWVSCTTSILALCGSLVLWRQWRGCL